MHYWITSGYPSIEPALEGPDVTEAEILHQLACHTGTRGLVVSGAIRYRQDVTA